MLTANEYVETRPNGSKRFAIFFNKVDEDGVLLTPPLTKQAFKKDCDINLILAKYGKSELLDFLNKYSGSYGTYGDFSDVLDFQDASDRILLAENMFMGMPAEIRKQFDNDPATFLAFVDKPENFDKMVSMGLAKPKAVDPVVAPVGEAAKSTDKQTGEF